MLDVAEKVPQSVSSQNWKPDLVLFHASCEDGFTAAWSAWMQWGDSVEYLPMGYGSSFPDVTGKHVLMVDFSAKHETLVQLGKVAASIVILDHHKSAAEDLRPFTIDVMPEHHMLPSLFAGLIGVRALPIIAHFDMEKSGARLAWEFCYGAKDIPTLVRYVEDRDLWRHKMPKSAEVAAALKSYEHTFLTWCNAAENTGLLIAEGVSILRARRKLINSVCGNAYQEEIAGYRVPVVNAPGEIASDACHELLNRCPEAPFAGSWYRSGNTINWSLRSEDHRADVSEVARRLNGGGHRNASGFKVRADETIA